MNLEQRLVELKTAMTQTENAFHALAGRKAEVEYLLELEKASKNVPCGTLSSNDSQTPQAEVIPCEMEAQA